MCVLVCCLKRQLPLQLLLLLLFFVFLSLSHTHGTHTHTYTHTLNTGWYLRSRMIGAIMKLLISVKPEKNWGNNLKCDLLWDCVMLPLEQRQLPFVVWDDTSHGLIWSGVVRIVWSFFASLVGLFSVSMIWGLDQSLSTFEWRVVIFYPWFSKQIWYNCHFLPHSLPPFYSNPTIFNLTECSAQCSRSLSLPPGVLVDFPAPYCVAECPLSATNTWAPLTLADPESWASAGSRRRCPSLTT